MQYAVYATLATLAGLASAKQCVNMTVPVQINARNAVFNQSQLRNNEDAATFTANFTSIAGGTNYTAEVLSGYATVTGTYNISAKFCQPNNGTGRNTTIQVLTHGIGFDKSYWDLPFNNFNYSYIDRMVDQYGYCTLSYDRLGIGMSSKGDPYNVIQAQAEISALYYMSNALRRGSFPGINLTFNGTNNKIVHVGHSYGSQQSYQLTMAYPNVSDGIVLTGFSFNGSALLPTISSFGSKIARQNQPFRFGASNAVTSLNLISRQFGPLVSGLNITLQNVVSFLSQYNVTATEALDTFQTTSLYDLTAGILQLALNPTAMAPTPQNLSTGYLTWSDAWANQYNFFFPSAYDPTIIPYAEANKQPYTVGEILTLGGMPAASPFTGPVHIITGRQDAIYCAGDCLATGTNVSSIIASAAQYFNSSRAFSAYVQPRAGHALNLHYNATGAYSEIASFLRTQGLAPAS